MNRNRGVTLMELVVYLTLLGLMTGLVGVRFLPSTGLDVSVKQLYTHLLYAQQAAMNSSALIGLEFDEANQTYKGVYLSDREIPSPFPRDPFEFGLKVDAVRVNAPNPRLLFGVQGVLVDGNGNRIDRRVVIQCRQGSREANIYIEPESGWIHR